MNVRVCQISLPFNHRTIENWTVYQCRYVFIHEFPGSWLPDHAEFICCLKLWMPLINSYHFISSFIVLTSYVLLGSGRFYTIDIYFLRFWMLLHNYNQFRIDRFWLFKTGPYNMTPLILHSAHRLIYDSQNLTQPR